MATLYTWPAAHGLPSVSPACMQAEAYLRMTGQEFTINICSTSTRSPTGQLPALEAGSQFPDPSKHEYDSARACISLAKAAVKNLDTQLNLGTRAEALAFSSLIESKLDPATEYSIWLEPKGYETHVKVAYASQPFPLNYIMPWNTKREVVKRYEGREGEAIYSAACDALAAIADKLRAAGGRYVLGEKPCSLDALLFGHLLFYRSSPSAAPALHAAVTGHPVLQQYLEHILSAHFSQPVPTVCDLPGTPAQSRPSSQAGNDPGAQPSTSADWSDAAKGQKKPSKTPELTAVEREFRRKSWWWLGGAAAVVIGYVLFTYDVKQFVRVVAEDDDDGDDMDDLHDHEDEE